MSCMYSKAIRQYHKHAVTANGSMGIRHQGVTADKRMVTRLPFHVLRTSLLAQHLADVMELHTHEAPHLLIWIGYQPC